MKTVLQLLRGWDREKGQGNERRKDGPGDLLKTYTNGKMLTRKGRLAQLNKFKYGGVIIWIWFIGSISDDYMQVKISDVQILKQISPLILGMRVNKDYLFIWLNWTSPVAVITPCLGLHSITSHTSSPWICLHQSLRHIFSRFGMTAAILNTNSDNSLALYYHSKYFEIIHRNMNRHIPLSLQTSIDKTLQFIA